MTITIGDLKTQLQQFSPDAEVTFGSSTFRKRPLVYYRCKWRGDSLHIETTELDSDSECKPEYTERIKVKELLKYIGDSRPDNSPVSFGCTIDAAPLEFVSVSETVSINLIQNETPAWPVED